jgi:NADH-quinone oxidoreductase subunit D
MSTEFTFPDNAARAAQAADHDEFENEKMSLSIGPSHPSTHGVLRLQLELDGDTITKCDPVIGYLHRGDEKIAENMTYNQFVPYTDRLDYLAPLANNAAYAIAVERLAGLEVPPRCQAIRVVTCELARISSHLVGLGAFSLDVGAWSVMLWCFTQREKLYTLFEELTGARFTTSYSRIGGVARDIPDGWLGRVGEFCEQFPAALDEITSPEDAAAILHARGCGVALFATAHASSREDLMKKPLFRKLLGDGAFSKLVTISARGGRRVYRVEDA